MSKHSFVLAVDYFQEVTGNLLSTIHCKSQIMSFLWSQSTTTGNRWYVCIDIQGWTLTEKVFNFKGDYEQMTHNLFILHIQN